MNAEWLLGQRAHGIPGRKDNSFILIRLEHLHQLFGHLTTVGDNLEDVLGELGRGKKKRQRGANETYLILTQSSDMSM